MASGTIGVWPVAVALDRNGLLAPGAKLKSWLAGTSTPVFLYTDAALGVAHPWPAVFNGYGQLTYFMGPLSYKLELLDANDVTIWGPIDNIPSTGLSTNIIGGEVWSFGGDASSPIFDLAYPAGATLDKCLAGSVPFHIDSANLGGTFALEVTMKGAGGATVSVSIVNLTDGSPDTPLATLTSSSLTGERKRSAAITFAVAGAAKDYNVKGKVDVGSGNAWGARLIRLT